MFLNAFRLPDTSSRTHAGIRVQTSICKRPGILQIGLGQKAAGAIAPAALPNLSSLLICPGPLVKHPLLHYTAAVCPGSLAEGKGRWCETFCTNLSGQTFCTNLFGQTFAGANLHWKPFCTKEIFTRSSYLKGNPHWKHLILIGNLFCTKELLTGNLFVQTFLDKPFLEPQNDQFLIRI